MAHLNPSDSYEHLEAKVLEGIKAQFPVKGRSTTLHLNDLEIGNQLHPDDIRGQVKAKMNGETWGTHVFATMEIKDNLTDAVIDRKRVKIAEIPKTTGRYSYVVNGQEYQVDNQWQLKPGVYARRTSKGGLKAQFNVAGKTGFDMLFDPANKQFTVAYKKANIKAYPLLKAMGVSDEELEATWGKQIYEANKNAPRASSALDQFYKTSTGKVSPSHEVSVEHLNKVMSDSKLRPEVTEMTLGKPFDHVQGETLRLASRKILDIQRGAPEDDRDNLIFKDLRDVGDFVSEKIKMTSHATAAKLQRQLNNPKTKSIRDVIRFDYFNEPIRQFFTKTSLSNSPTQTNPLQMVSSAMQTTIMGPGGIKSERGITNEAKMINPSHLGFLDPIHTPESEKTGITLRLPTGVRKRGNDVVLQAYNLKTGRTEDITPLQFMRSRVVLPDQVSWKGGKPTPISDSIRYVGEHNKIQEGKFGDADYVLRHSSQLFNITSNLIPFLGNSSGGRAGMASRHLEQAIALEDREAPLVQVSLGNTGEGPQTFEQLLGYQSSHRSPVAGSVTKIRRDAMVVTDKDGKEHEVQLYHNYPLNDVKGMFHSTPVVEVGAKVKANQLLADTNFSKGGTLALGTNLRVAYVPFKGYNFEDGVVISDAASKKLTSVHLHKPTLKMDEKIILDPKRFGQQHPGLFKPEQVSKLDEHGVIRIGQKVKTGDPIIIAMKPFEMKDRTGFSAIRKSIGGHHSNSSVLWDSEFEGEVVGVHKTPEKLVVHVRTLEPMQVGDKLAGRYGNKGIVTKILPNDEMPRTPDGKATDVLLNPSGIPGRMNIGQVLETAVAKIAQKTGKPYIVNNFDPNTPDYLTKVKAELKTHGLADTEDLYDPVAKIHLGKALVGPQYLLKLVHQVEKKLSVRSGVGLPGIQSAEPYDINLQPAGGSGAGGQSLSHLGIYSLLAHGAKANLREMQTWKSEGADPQGNEFKKWPSQHVAVWKAIQEGTPLPMPTPTFAFKKFTDMLKGAGINIEKKGHDFVLGPLTNKSILQMSGGELTQASKSPVRAKVDAFGEFKPMAGGLFDEIITGGHGGSKWSHIKLAEPIPNPVFEKAIRGLTGLKEKQFHSVVIGENGVDPATGAIVEARKGITGGAGIKALLDRIDVKKELEVAKRELKGAPSVQVDRALKKVKYLTTLQKLDLKPSDAYILHNLPIVPPVIRPLMMIPDRAIKYEDINGLYMQFDAINSKLKDPNLAPYLTDKKKVEMRESYYDGVKALMGIGTINKDRKERGFLDQISGTQPKLGFFQKTLLNRRQDLSMRSTIVPEPSLGIDEIGLPKDSALTLFRPFLIRQLVLQGIAPNAALATKTLAAVHNGKEDPMVWKALEQVMKERPVLFKRDPALHKYSIQAFRPRLVTGNAIQIHPLVTGGFNADFDGDTMAVYVPISHEAVTEAHKMFPSNNVFNEASGHVMYQPTLESALGLYKMSLVGKQTSHSFKTSQDAAEALKSGTVHYSDIIKLEGKNTTPGRVLLASVLPSGMRAQVLHDMDYRIDKDGLSSMLSQLGKKHGPEFGRVVDAVKDLGYGASYGVIKTDLVKGGNIGIGTHSLSLDDFTVDRATRDPILHTAKGKADVIYKNDKLTKVEQDRQAVNVWLAAADEMKKTHIAKEKGNPSNLFMMERAKVKPSWDQYKQMVLAPMVFQDSANQDIPLPVTKSYSEGLDLGGYWTQLYGARRGAVMKVQEVAEPGYLTKLLIGTTMNMMVEKPDCGTKKGIVLPVSEKDIHDRYLVQDFKAGHVHIPTGTLLTPDIVGQMRAADKNAKILVRSPLKCEAEHGLCQKCLGVSVTGAAHPMGTNIGIEAAQTVGERAMQLMLKGFHTGGVSESGGGAKIINQFDHFNDLTRLPEHIRDAATVARVTGKIDKVVPNETGVDVFIGGRSHFIGRDVSGEALHTIPKGSAQNDRYHPWTPPTVGTYVEAGQSLSDPNRTVINPHDLYEATGSMESVQNHLTNEMHKLYSELGVRRRMLETMVKSMSNLTKIDDSGDHPYVLRGEFHPTSVIKRINETELKGKNPILHRPVLQGVNMLPLYLQEDWMAKLQHQRLEQTLMEAASQGQAAHIHGSHPIAGLAYGAEFGKPPVGVKGIESHHY